MLIGDVGRVEVFESRLWLRGFKFYDRNNKLILQVGRFTNFSFQDVILKKEERIIGIRSGTLKK